MIENQIKSDIQELIRNTLYYHEIENFSYQELLDLSSLILYNEISFVDITDGALFYHADYVTPGWAKTKQRTVEIEDHIFYRWEIE